MAELGKAALFGPFFPRYLETREEIHLGATFSFGDGSSPLYDGHKIGRPYCPFTLWTDKQTVQTVCKMRKDELEANLHNILRDGPRAEKKGLTAMQCGKPQDGNNTFAPIDILDYTGVLPTRTKMTKGPKGPETLI